MLAEMLVEVGGGVGEKGVSQVEAEVVVEVEVDIMEEVEVTSLGVRVEEERWIGRRASSMKRSHRGP